MTPAGRVALTIVHAYQLMLSPFAGGACRFDPSCSAYATQAIEAHGARRGTWLALRRFARCHPFTRPGYDPVPPSVLDRAASAGTNMSAPTRS
jgi:uncharacterized protein